VVHRASIARPPVLAAGCLSPFRPLHLGRSTAVVRLCSADQGLQGSCRGFDSLRAYCDQHFWPIRRKAAIRKPTDWRVRLVRYRLVAGRNPFRAGPGGWRSRGRRTRSRASAGRSAHSRWAELEGRR